MIDLESLQCFEFAAEELNFRKAAVRAHLSAAAFGERIRNLEELLDAKLFERTTRRVRLTAQGQMLRPQARRTLTEADRCLTIFDDENSDKEQYSITLGTRFELGMSWIIPNLERLTKLQPQRNIHLYFGDSPDLLMRLDRHEIDAFISSYRITSTQYESITLYAEDYDFVASPKLIKKQPIRTAEQAENHTLIDLHRDLPLFSYFLDAVEPEELWAFQKTEYLGTIAAAKHRILQGAGVGVLPRYFIERELKNKSLVRIKPKVNLPSDHFRLVWRKRDPLSSRMNVLAEELLSFPLS